MKYYIATRLDRADAHREMRAMMDELGHDLTYDSTTHGSVFEGGPDVMREIGRREMRGVLDAELVIVMLPGGRGTHIEMGMALAAGKHVLLQVDPAGERDALEKPCSFYHMSAAWMFGRRDLAYLKDVIATMTSRVGVA